MNYKIKRAQNILRKRLPKGYFAEVKIYKTTKLMFKAVAKKYFHGNYKRCIAWYENRIQNSKLCTYMTTKYCHKGKRSKSKDVLSIAAIATVPISLSLKSVNELSMNDICFLLLHEIGHEVLNSLDERKCDMFAIRWIRKLLKEGLIKGVL